MTMSTHSDKKFARTLTMLVVATALLVALMSSSAIADAKGNRQAVFGTVVAAPANDSIDIATRDGLITLVIDNKTKIDTKRGRLPLDEVSAGDSVAGYYTEGDGELTATKLSFKPRKADRQTKHVVGVVVDKEDDTLTVLTPDGETVEVTPSDDPENDPTEPGSLIITVVEENLETGDLDAKAVVTAERTIARLNDAIDHEISLAQSQLLKIRMSETASIHLTQLYETLDEIKAESKAKIEAAFAEFQANYTTTLDENLLAPPLVHITGKVLAKTLAQIIIVKNGNGRRSFVLIPADVEVILPDGTTGTYGEVLENSFVDISAIPQSQTSSPIARIIEIQPDAETPGNSGGNSNKNGNGNNSAEKLRGTIILVTPSNDGTHTIIVVDSSVGPDTAAAVTDSTIVTGDGELAPGVQVEVTLESDGFTAKEVEIIEQEESSEAGTPAAAPTPTPEATATETPTATATATPTDSEAAEGIYPHRQDPIVLS
jgi:hypothetical protein